MTTPTPEQIEAAFYALRSETIEETWFERELRQALTAKDARIKELEEALRDIFAVDDTAKNGTEYENEMSIALQKAKTLAAKE